jgi:tRNA threonylcarbamoyladenosine modification (KEOPS) complex  Pcc1 subunit
MDEKTRYVAIISEIIARQSIILGPDIAILKARSVVGLTVNDKGIVTDIKGDSSAVLQQLVNTYVELSGMIVKNALGSIFEKYPDINKVN